VTSDDMEARERMARAIGRAEAMIGAAREKAAAVSDDLKAGYMDDACRALANLTEYLDRAVEALTEPFNPADVGTDPQP
jgi:hypothetical protein